MSTLRFTPEQADQTITRIMKAAAELEKNNYFGNEKAIIIQPETAELIRNLRNQLKNQSSGRIKQRLARLEPTPNFALPLDEQVYNDKVSDLQLAGYFKLEKLLKRFAAKNNNTDLLKLLETNLTEIEKQVQKNDEFILLLRDL
jgi:hypothetical protein